MNNTGNGRIILSIQIDQELFLFLGVVSLRGGSWEFTKTVPDERSKFCVIALLK